MAFALTILFVACSRSGQEGRRADPYPPPRVPAAARPLSFGAVLVTNSPTWAHVLRRSNTPGALVLAVFPDSAAEAAQIEPGQVIVNVEGVAVRSADQATLLLRSSPQRRQALTLIGPDDRARAVTVELSGFHTLATRARLEEQLAHSPDPLHQYLAALFASDWQQAAGLARSVVEEEPEFSAGHSLFARLRLRERRPGAPVSPDLSAEITDSLERAMELDPTSAEVFASASAVLLDLGRAAEAESVALRAVVNDNRSAHAHHVLGLTRLVLGRSDAALPDLHRAVALDPYIYDYYRSLARVYQRLHRPTDADATRDALASLQAGAAPPPPRGAHAPTVGLLLALFAVAGALPPVLRAGRADGTDPRRSTTRPRRITNLGLAEGLAVLGAWSAAIPLVGPAFDLAPKSTTRLEVTDHFLPGLFVLVVSGALARTALRGGASVRQIRATAAVCSLAGLFTASAHAPLVLQAMEGVRPWGAVLLHSTPGPMIILAAAWLYASARAVPSPRREGPGPDQGLSVRNSELMPRKA